MAVGCMGTRVHVAHARTLMCMLGCLSNLVMGYFEKTFLLAVTRTRASSQAFSPLSLPLTLCLQAEGGLLYLEEDAGTAGSCWQAVEREVCSLDLHRPPPPPAMCTFALGLTEGKAVEPAWVEALVVGPACHLPLQWGHNGA